MFNFFNKRNEMIIYYCFDYTTIDNDSFLLTGLKRKLKIYESNFIIDYRFSKTTNVVVVKNNNNITDVFLRLCRRNANSKLNKYNDEHNKINYEK